MIIVELPHWLDPLLLPLLALVLVLLLVAVSIAAVRQLRASALGAKKPRPAAIAQPPLQNAGSNLPATDAGLRGAARTVVRQASASLNGLTGGSRGIDAVQLLVLLGARSADLPGLIPTFGAGSTELSGKQRELFRGGCSFAIYPAGGIVSFDDGLLGSETRDTRWEALLSALLKFRADRPFDGLVIVLPASDFFGADKKPEDALMLRGDELYQMIWVAQRAGGWRVPIYLVLSGCEVLTGFSATTAALSELQSSPQSSAFGWAVPYALGSAFERSWVREGVDALVKRLSVLQTRLLMRPRDTRTSEELLLFPDAVAALADPLSALLTPMLRPSAYREAFMFRGFYLTGDPRVSSQGTLASYAAPLFTTRVFPEHVLAQPAQGARTRAQRRVTLAQMVLALLVVMALVGILQVRDYGGPLTTIRPLINAIASLGERLQAVYPSHRAVAAAPSDNGVTATDVRQILDLMSDVSANSLETAWAPLSYVSSAYYIVESAIRTVYRVAVLQVVNDRLTNHIRELLRAPNPQVSKTPGQSCGTTGGTPGDLTQLSQILQRLQIYATQLQAYQTLTHEPIAKALESLLEFSLSITLPSSFNDNNGLYLSALKGAVAPPLMVDAIQNSVGAILRDAFRNALIAAYPSSPIALAVGAIAANANLGASSASFGAVTQLERIRALTGALHEVRTTAPENGWLQPSISAPAIAQIDQIASLANSRLSSGVGLMDPNLLNTFQQDDRYCASRTRAVLWAAAVPGGVKVLLTDRGKAQLSAPLAALIPTLDRFLAQPVATVTVPRAGPFSAAADGPLFWVQQDLQALQAVTEAYLAFAAQDLPADLPPLLAALPQDTPDWDALRLRVFYAAFRAQMQATAGEQLEQMVAVAVAHAQHGAGPANGRPGGIPALREETARFTSAAPILMNLRMALSGAGRPVIAEHLDQLLADQAVRLLTQVDRLLTTADPYQMVDRTLSFWSGSPPLAAAAFGAATLPDLVGTLPARRDYVEALARDHAAPMVSYLQQSNVLLSTAGTAMLKRWQGIMDTLDRYHRGDPANSLSRLEQFISADMDRIDLVNCNQFVAPAGGGTNWFAEQLGNIRTAVISRCNGAVYGNAVSVYGDLASQFNTTLAGRFPFGGPRTPDADPGDVKRLFDRFGPELATLETRTASINSLARAGAVQFLRDLRAAQTALAPMLADPAPDAPLTYHVAVDFRTNIGSDPGANQVAETTVRFGQQSLSSFAVGKTMAWSNGQDVQVLLRWAENSPSVPAGGPAPAQVRGLTVSYDCNGAWGLLRLLAAQRPAPGLMSQLSDRRPETVGFSVDLQPNPNAAAGGDPAVTEARLLMRFGLTAVIHTPGQPDTRQPVTLPVFPTAAPQPGATSARLLR